MPPFVKRVEPLKFNRWTFVKEGSRQIMWVCRCDCGTVKEVNKKNVKAGLSKSCGCLNLENLTKHGLSKTAEYSTWKAMIGRVDDLKSNRAKDYAGRGIKVCQRWRDSFEAFYEDMGPKPSDDHSLDRKDNDGDYCPENCRWATRSEQQRNKRTTNQYTLNGKTQSAVAWAEEYGVPEGVLWYRLSRGWDLETALVTPQQKPRGPQTTPPKDRVIEYQGRSQTMAEWAEEFGLTVKIVDGRLNAGWSMDRIRLKPPRSDAKLP